MINQQEGFAVSLQSTNMRSDTISGLDAAVDGVGLAPMYQPVVSLPDGTVVGYEALARWTGQPDLSPQTVFARAKATGRLDRLDQRCIDSAIEGALKEPLGRGSVLLVNCEPASEYVGRDADPILARGHEKLNLVFELTERSLLTRPHTLLRKVQDLRADGFAIALDDVGANSDSLALLDVLRPEVIKLDIELVQSQPREHRARTLAAVLAHHERTGAVILAEGIETREHLDQALAMGASLGQGYLFGRAGRIGPHTPVEWLLPASGHDARLSARSPFDLVASRSLVRTARKPMLTAYSRHIESHAFGAVNPPMVLTALQRADYFTPTTRRRYCEIAEMSPLVAVFGEDMRTDLGPRIRGVPLDRDDPLCQEWTVLVLGPHAAAALLGREHPSADGDDESQRRFDFVITADREVVTLAARNLLDRITGS